MKRKWFLRGLAGLIMVLVVLSVALAFSLGAIVKKEVEKIGPAASKVEIKLKSAQVWLFAERVQLTGFVLGNPPGYKMPTAIEVDSVTIRVKAATVFSDRLVVESINVKKPIITLEGGLKDNNLTRIQKNVNDYVGSAPTAPPTDSTAPPSSPATAEKKLQVNELVITGARLQLNTTLSGGRTIILPIPDIHLTDLGVGPEGITPVEVGQRALHAILVSATKAMAKNAGELGKEGFDEAKGATKKLQVHKFVDKLKGFFH